MQYLINVFNRYMTVRKRLDKYTTVSTTIYSVLLALLLTAVVIVPAILITIPFMMFIDLQILMTIIIFLIVIAGIVLFEYLMYYITGLFHPEVKKLNTKLLVIIEASVINLIVVIIGLLVVIDLFMRL